MNPPDATAAVDRQRSFPLAPRRIWAIVPAAGKSARMGAAKLLLPWKGKPLIEHLIAAYRAGGAAEVLVVVRPDDPALAAHCRALGAAVIVPDEAPPEMKDSVRAALDYIAANFRPTSRDAWLLAPADLPQLSPQAVAQLAAADSGEGRSILVAAHAGKRGHPALFPWPLAAEVRGLGKQEGVNALLLRHAVVEIQCGAECLAADIDTPDDYRRLASS